MRTLHHASHALEAEGAVSACSKRSAWPSRRWRSASARGRPGERGGLTARRHCACAPSSAWSAWTNACARRRGAPAADPRRTGTACTRQHGRRRRPSRASNPRSKSWSRNRRRCPRRGERTERRGFTPRPEYRPATASARTNSVWHTLAHAREIGTLMEAVRACGLRRWIAGLDASSGKSRHRDFPARPLARNRRRACLLDAPRRGAPPRLWVSVLPDLPDTVPPGARRAAAALMSLDPVLQPYSIPTSRNAATACCAVRWHSPASPLRTRRSG